MYTAKKMRRKFSLRRICNTYIVRYVAILVFNFFSFIKMKVESDTISFLKCMSIFLANVMIYISSSTWVQTNVCKFVLFSDKIILQMASKKTKNVTILLYKQHGKTRKNFGMKKKPQNLVWTDLDNNHCCVENSHQKNASLSTWCSTQNN